MRYEDDEFDTDEDLSDFIFPVEQIRQSKGPLRWAVDYVIHPISMIYFTKGLEIYYKYEEEYESDENFVPPFFYKTRMSIYNKIYSILDVPYAKWGTYYKMNDSAS